MGRFPQPVGARGSLKWIQIAVNEAPVVLDQAILPKLGAASRIDWLSPVASDEFAEYRDGASLDRLQLAELGNALTDFWPLRGPQWDALGRSDAGDVILVEAKAHIAELCSPGTKAGEDSRRKISQALRETIEWLGAAPLAGWDVAFYQLANRLAHLHFLRSNGIPAWLVLVNFVGDAEMKGPKSREAWEAAYAVAWHVMGLGKRHKLSPYIVEVHPEVPFGTQGALR